MSSYGGLPAPQSALDFCKHIDARQRAFKDVGVQLDDQAQAQLDNVLKDYERDGTSAALERQALRFLFVFHEQEQLSPVLTADERARLEAILVPPVTARATPVSQFKRQPSRLNLSWPDISLRRGLLGLAAVGLIVLGGTGIAHLVENSRQGTPPPGVAQQHPPAQQVLPGTTELQNFKQNYGPFNQVAPSHLDQHSGTQALLFLEDGGYFDSATWTIDPTAAGWQQDIAGNVNNVDVRGNLAGITNPDGLPYTVGIDQPFVFSGNPGTVLRIDPTGNVLSMSLAQATAVRHVLTK